jgi:two-component system chemotaxis response regulator CheB
MLRDALTKRGCQVVGSAADAYEARQIIKSTEPDVITLDVEMPRMNGLEFLKMIMALRPMPVIMVSSTTQAGADATLEALNSGAVDFVPKPNSESDWTQFSITLSEKVRAASRVRFLGKSSKIDVPIQSKTTKLQNKLFNCEIIAIGASTGGVAALSKLISSLPSSAPPVLITQHMPEGFTERFARRLNRSSQLDVQEAKDGKALCKGQVRIAPGHRHLYLERIQNRLHTKLCDGPPISGHRPSVDVLFSSVAKTSGRRSVGVILTGMGKDGAKGLKEMRSIGAYTIGEAKSSCIVYGMSKTANEIGAVIEELGIDEISRLLRSIIDGRPVGSPAALKGRANDRPAIT